MKRTIVVTGGTGFVGRRLVARLLGRGDRVVVLSRHPDPSRLPAGAEAAPWRPEALGPWTKSLEGADAVVNLAGEPVMGARWTEAKRRTIYDSRVVSTRRLVEAIGALAAKPRAFVSASAVGYYGARPPDEVLAEDAGPGEGFLARVVVDWEAAALGAEPLGVRVVLPRIGLVLGPEGGVLHTMVPAFRLFAGGPLGSGEQVIPWVHAEDMVSLLVWAIDDERASGPINATAPHPVSMEAFASAVGRALGRPAALRVPALALRAALGEAAEPILTGQRAIPRRALDLGFAFRHPEIDGALGDLLGPSASAPS
ncbi:MAG TPA: TIGR01777 family oxidoreductase [Polyangiaceae bacterium]|nr:TIGR01777 family oxidoreductase [Polyangiaceae bacterium]